MSIGRIHRARTGGPMSDINMTPLIDVMLVLLVIFIIAAPLMAGSLRLELPRSDAASPSAAAAVLDVSIDAEGVLRLGDEVVTLERLSARAATAAKAAPKTEVHLRADMRVPYGRVAELIGTVQKAGLTRIGFVAAPSASLALQPSTAPVVPAATR